MVGTMNTLFINFARLIGEYILFTGKYILFIIEYILVNRGVDSVQRSVLSL